MFGSKERLIDVAVHLVNGDCLRGGLAASAGSTLEGILSRETPFLQFQTREGERRFISKLQVLSIEPLEPLKKANLEAQRSNSVDCFAVLGLDRGASLDDAQLAFRAAAKKYHPDKMSGLDLPREVERYMNDMFRLINAAFAEVKAEIKSKRKFEAA